MLSIDEAITLLKFNNKHISDLKNDDLQQIAEWLEDYKRIKMLIPIEQALKAEYNKAIDDFVNQFNVIVDEKCGTDTNNYFRKIVKEVSEQLKESGAK